MSIFFPNLPERVLRSKSEDIAVSYRLKESSIYVQDMKSVLVHSIQPSSDLLITLSANLSLMMRPPEQEEFRFQLAHQPPVKHGGIEDTRAKRRCTRSIF